MEVYCGEKATQVYDKDTWLPEETIEALKEYIISIKGPLTTPVGGGIRSLNVSLRQMLDLYVCLRPIRYFDGVPSPVKRPQDVDMTIFRENSEDIYYGVLSFLEKQENPILFIDEIHTIIGAGSASGGSLDVSNLLKPALGKGEIRCIGSTTFQEYRGIFNQNQALSRRFQKIDVIEPNDDECEEILNGIKDIYEE